ncbi:uncharacterized protein [Aegilops tauschii subsp. strangulata]|uniref:uncharacterized protein n=1 Tax=Aegilops tauschii subsp. strangulata TaxID=200361 RepID=UPI000989BD7F|nr:uncharacterized protein LOC109744018 [Aegilops tauschii subsp. strangulata]
METLPDDVVVEILARVTDVAALFRCAAMCKRCRLLIAERSFLRRRWPEGVSHACSLLGFFAMQQPREEPTEGSSTATPMPPFTPVPWSPLGERHRSLTITAPGGRGCQVTLLTSRRGLLVMRFFPLEEPSDWYIKTMNLTLYDPIAGKSRQLPELKSNRPFRIQGCALLTREDCCPDKTRGAASSVPSSFLKVLIIGVDQDEPGADQDEPRHNLHVFTSTKSSSSWNTPRKCFQPLEDGTRVVSQQISAVVCQGTAHWLFSNTSNLYALTVCARTTEMSLTRIPVTPDHPRLLLGVTDGGSPSLLRLDGQCTMLEIWTCRTDNMSGDSNTGRWHCTKMIELRPPEWSKIDQAQCVCVGETSGKLLIKDNQEDMYIVDLQTGAMEAVTSWFRGIVLRAIPFEMDWPAFFTRRLANTRIKRTKPGGVLSKFADPFWGQIVVTLIIVSIAMSWA